MNSDHVLVERDGAIGRITFDAPERLNAVDPPMLRAIVAAVQDCDADPQVRVIALRGAGRAFSAGADLTRSGDGVAQIPVETALGVGAVSAALVAASTPTVALVPGVAAGAGVSIALACDYVLAGESSRWVLAFGAIGLMPDAGGTALVAANIGRARALRLALTGEQLRGPVAAEWGLVSECVPDADFDTRAEEILAHLAAGPPLAWADTTAAINAATIDIEATLAIEEPAQQRLLASDDLAEGLAAFLEKRAPTFRGR